MNMKEFDTLLEIIERLLGPGGCPWDREQTLSSLRSLLMEEACEVIDAIDLNENSHIQEELGDLLFNAVFLCRIAQKEDRFSISDVIEEINEKLIRRHPHVFGDVKNIHTTEDLYIQWDKIKKTEKGKENRESALDGISKHLPSLARAQKAVKRMRKAGFDPQIPSELIYIHSEKELGQHLLSLVELAEQKGLEAESALRKALTHLKQEFVQHEKKHS